MSGPRLSFHGSCLAVLAAAWVLSINTPVVRADMLSFDDELTAVLCGYVYVDVNDTGTWDEPEHGLFDVTITLDGVDDEGNPITLPMPTITTNPDGSYCFEGLMPGVYTITETTPLKYLEGQHREMGTIGGEYVGHWGKDDPRNQIVNIRLAAGDCGVDYNFCEWGLKAEYISKSPYLIIPEPSVFVLLAMVLPGLFGLRWYRRRRA